MRKYQKGFISFDWTPILVFLGVVAAVLVGGAVAITAAVKDNTVSEEQFHSRALEKLSDVSLSAITVSKFAKQHKACAKEVPYGADFVAKNKDDKVVEGTVCTSASRESKLIFKK